MAALPSSVVSWFASFLPGFRLIDGSDLQNMANASFSTKSGITALAGGGLASGTPVCSAAINEVLTCATDNDSVQLPPAVPGSQQMVINNSGHTAAVFAGLNPLTGAVDSIIANNSVAGAASVTLATTKVAIFACYAPGKWKELLTA